MSSNKCPICEKGVYPMDKQISLDGLKYHTPCAKCMDCQCQITLKNFCKTPDNKLLCKTHYFRRFHEENSYIGGDKFERKSSRDTKSLSPSTSSISDNDNESKEDGGSSLVAIKEDDNKPTATASFFEKDQLSTKENTTKTNDTQLTVETTDYKPVSVKDMIKKSSSTVSSSSSSPSKPNSPVSNRFSSLGVSDKCPCCQKTIYPMDKHINLDGTKYHTECAKCTDCKCQINLKNFTRTPDPSILVCKTHYFRRFHEENSYVGGEKFQKTSPRDAKANAKQTGDSSSAIESPSEPTTTTDKNISNENDKPIHGAGDTKVEEV